MTGSAVLNLIKYMTENFSEEDLSNAHASAFTIATRGKLRGHDRSVASLVQDIVALILDLKELTVEDEK